jgi:signal transduction histidine kinase
LPDAPGADEVPARVRYELLAVLKESLANTAKHAGARTVTVDLATNNGDLRLTIKDDGKGFDPTSAAAGTGLKNLRERVHQAGGTVQFETKPGGGTMVVACLPRKTAEHS